MEGKPNLKASTFAIRAGHRTDQKLQKSLLCQRRQKLFLKNSPTLQKKIKIHHHAARQTQPTMTIKLNTAKAYNDKVDKRPAGNTGLAKVAVQCSADPPRRMVNQSLVLHINPPRRMVKIATFAKPENVIGK